MFLLMSNWRYEILLATKVAALTIFTRPVWHRTLVWLYTPPIPSSLMPTAWTYQSRVLNLVQLFPSHRTGFRFCTVELASRSNVLNSPLAILKSGSVSWLQRLQRTQEILGFNWQTFEKMQSLTHLGPPLGNIGIRLSLFLLYWSCPELAKITRKICKCKDTLRAIWVYLSNEWGFTISPVSHQHKGIHEGFLSLVDCSRICV